jgi:hypothetical protein
MAHSERTARSEGVRGCPQGQVHQVAARQERFGVQDVFSDGTRARAQLSRAGANDSAAGLLRQANVMRLEVPAQCRKGLPARCSTPASELHDCLVCCMCAQAATANDQCIDQREFSRALTRCTAPHVTMSVTCLCLDIGGRSAQRDAAASRVLQVRRRQLAALRLGELVPQLAKGANDAHHGGRERACPHLIRRRARFRRLEWLNRNLQPLCAGGYIDGGRQVVNGSACQSLCQALTGACKQVCGGMSALRPCSHLGHSKSVGRCS